MRRYCTAFRAASLGRHTSSSIVRQNLPLSTRASSLPISRAASTLVDAAPRIAQPSLWKSIVPKVLRGEGKPSPPGNKPQQSKEWNPFMIYIFIFMLIGSNAINLIGLRNEILNFSQKTDRQIALLAEVIRKVQNGEDVDVAAVLGKGNPEAEKDWEEVLKELESTDSLYNNEKKKLENRARKLAGGESKREREAESANSSKTAAEESTRRRVGFY